MSFNLAKCNYCGDCFDICRYTNHDKNSASLQIKKLINGEKAEILTECVTCAACNSYCSKGANPFDLILWLQEKYNLYKTTESYRQRLELIGKLPSAIEYGDKDKPVFNICCVAEALPNLFDGKLFEGATFLKGGDYESELGTIHIGTERLLRDNLQEKVINLAATGFNEIIMLHDDCYAAYTTKALEYRIDVPFTVKHYIEYLRDYLLNHRDKIQVQNMKIAYQQPCSSRYTPWINEPLNELFDLMGVIRVERLYDGLHALCCGSPISPHQGHEVGEQYKKYNIEDALKNGAEAFVFMCPVCALQMRDEVAEAGMEPIFLTNLVRRAIGESLKFQGAGLGDKREGIELRMKVLKGLA